MDVFISYARRVHSDEARLLASALDSAGIRTFIDIVGIAYGDRFTKVILEALLNSRVVVVFVSEPYFQSWFCLREWEIAKTLSDTRGTAQVPDWIVVAGDGNFSSLPPDLRTTQWPKASDTPTLVKCVQAALATHAGSIRDRIGATRAQQITTTFLESAAIPPPATFPPLYIAT
jgi:TIR domain